MIEIEFFPYEHIVKDNFRGRNTTEIHLWALNRNSDTCLLRVQDYYPSCYIELPDLNIEWNSHNAIPISNWIKTKMSEDIISISETERRPLYYYNEHTSLFLFVQFKSSGALNRFKHICCRKNFIKGIGEVQKIDIWEDKIVLDLKLFVEMECEYASWISAIAEVSIKDKVSNDGVLEYILKWESMKRIALEECLSWKLTFRKLSFDIECYTDNHKAIPNPLEPNHIVTMISCIYDPGNGILEKYAIVTGICKNIDGANIIIVNDEESLMKEFCSLIQKLNPNIILGYNIYSFDYPYINTRHLTRMRDWPVMGMLLDEPSTLKGRQWSSRALVGNNISYLQMDGRISIDIFPLIRRDYKLHKYSLDFVSKHFLQRGKHDISPQEMFIIHEKMMSAIESKDLNRIDKISEEVSKVVSYCLEDSILVNDLFDTLKLLPNLMAYSNTMYISMLNVVTQGQQIRCLSQLYNIAKKHDYVLNRRPDSDTKAAGGYVGEPVATIHDNIIVVDFASMYPSIIMAYNLCYTTMLREKPLIRPNIKIIEKDIFKEDKSDLKEADWYGAFLCEQEEDNNIEVKDETIPGYEEDSDDEEEKAKTIMKQYIHRFVKKDVKVGLVPLLVGNLIDKRAEVRKQLKTEKDPTNRIQLDAKQLALKVSANSIYGVTGLQNGLIALIEMTMTVTSIGRNLITTVNSYCENKYKAKIVYNDTDSSMIDFGITDPSKCHEMGKIIEKEISGTKDAPGLFPPPLRVEFEKAIRLFTIKKKKYAYYSILEDGSLKTSKSGEIELGVKGIILARRDNPQFLRDTYEKILRNIMNKNDLKSSMDLLLSTVSSLLKGNIPLAKLEIVRQLGSNYKSDNFYMNVFAMELAKIEYPVKPGDRLGYVILRNGEEKLGKKMKLTELVELKPRIPIRNKNYDEIDYIYYLDHIMINAMDQLISLGHYKDLEPIKSKGYQPPGTAKLRSITHPIALISKLITDVLKGKNYNNSHLKTLPEQISSYIGELIN